LISTKNNREYKPLTSDNILALVGEQEILRHYLGFDFDLKTCYLSTLRDNDLAPSLNFYYNKAGRLCYKDFGHSQGNVFDFVKTKYDITYKEVLEKINSDMGLGLGVSKTFNRPVRYLEFNRDFKKENSLLQFKPVKYGEKELEWWSSYGITSLDTLKHFKIFNTEIVWLNKRPHWVRTEDNPIYTYYFSGSKKIKIYRPLAKPYVNARGQEVKGKWMTNCDAFDIQGLEQLPPSGDILINTSSMKDVALFYELMGMPAIAPQGEGHHIPKSIQEHLWTRFKRIITIYDNDSAGVKASIKINEDMGSEYWNIPKDAGVKDPTDFYNRYGKEETIKLLKTII
jgi:hypothetical protein